MKIILLIIPSMIYSATEAKPNQTSHAEAHQILSESIPTFKNISNQLTKTLFFNMTDFMGIATNISVKGEISRNYFNVNFSTLSNLDQLNHFKEATASLNNGTNIGINVINIVISLINNIFTSIPKEEITISTESNFLMRLLKMDNPNKITLSVTHECYGNQIIFNCYLSEDPKTIVTKPNSNEKEEENESKPLLEKKQK